MEAVELVLKSFYAMGQPLMDTLPSEIDTKANLMIKALMVSERYQADICKEKIAEALSNIPASQLTLQLSQTVYLLPQTILDLQQLNGIRCNIKAKFYYQMFLNNAIVTIKEPDLLNAFLALPHAYILEWIKQDNLKVHSENDVVYLLNEWIEKNEPSPDEMDCLIKEIRVINLGPAYLHQILPDFKWFKKSVHHKHHRSAQMAREFKGSIEVMKRQMPDFPPSWLSAPRNAPDYFPPASTICTWILKEDQLEKLYRGKNSVYSETAYHNGHWVKGRAFLNKPEGAEFCSLGSCLDIHGRSQCLVPLSVNMSIDKVEDAAEKKLSGTSLLKSNCGIGWTDFLHRKCPTIQEVVAPYLVDGKLTIKYEISEVDQPLKIAVP